MVSSSLSKSTALSLDPKCLKSQWKKTGDIAYDPRVVTRRVAGQTWDLDRGRVKKLPTPPPLLPLAQAIQDQSDVAWRFVGKSEASTSEFIHKLSWSHHKGK